MSKPPQPPVISAPPRPLPEPARKATGARQTLLVLLNLCLGLFLLDAVVSLADDSLTVLFDIRFLAAETRMATTDVEEIVHGMLGTAR